MHFQSTLCLTGFVLTSLLSVASAHPRPQSLAIREALNPAILSSSSKSHTSSTNRHTQQSGRLPAESKKQKDRDREDLPDHREPPDFDLEPIESGESGSSDNDVKTGGGGLECAAPLTQQFAAQLDNGHGCKKIAEAFQECKRTDLWYCQDLKMQKNCLCKGRNLDTG